jgi:dihydrodipicolinate synthase/N-acetylneuraminate lyase
LRQHLLTGQVIPAHPLALTPTRSLDERRQVALTRYYLDAGAGGLAVGVHTTQFRIRDHGLLRPVLELAAETTRAWSRDRAVALIAGVVGDTAQAMDEVALAADAGYDAVLVSLAALASASTTELVRHCQRLADALPVIGFYLQPAVGGRVLDFGFWREFAEIPGVVAVKIAPFNRYQTLDVVRAVVEAGRTDIALYTGNDDNIVVDLLTPYRFECGGRVVERRIAGGLLGQWAVWTKRAVELLQRVQRALPQPLSADWLAEAAHLTDANGAVFDVRHHFAGCIPGIHEVLRRQGLLAGTWCLDVHEKLSPGQARALDRVCRAYPHLTDDDFVAEHLARWLA